MADVTVGGQEITFDLNKITIKEFRRLFNTDLSPDDEYEILAKVSGLTVDEVSSLGYADWRQFTASFFEKCREPLDDPNSASESGST